MKLRVSMTFEFNQDHLEKARWWAENREIPFRYKDTSRLLSDALEAGVFTNEAVRFITCKEA